MGKAAFIWAFIGPLIKPQASIKVEKLPALFTEMRFNRCLKQAQFLKLFGWLPSAESNGVMLSGLFDIAPTA